MTIELNTVSYLLLAAIFSAASIIAVRDGKCPDVHPLVLSNQGEFSALRYPGESAVIKASAYPNGAPSLLTRDTLSELYQVALKKYKNKQFLGARKLTGKRSIVWVNTSATNTIVCSHVFIICVALVWYDELLH